MTNGIELKICFQVDLVQWELQLRIIDYLWKLCCLDTVWVFFGEICREKFGDFRVVHTRFCRWNQKGVWERIFLVLAEDADNEYAIIDSTIVRAHQHSAGAKGGIKMKKRSVVVKVV